jgi:site-specific DNA-methyltransferase (adenine-specific)
MIHAQFKTSQGDALPWLASLPSSSVDLVITDPPYESLEKHRSVGTTTRLKVSKSSSNEWFEVIPNSAFPALFTQIYRVLRRNSHFYLFCDQETMFVAKPAAEAAGFKFWKPLVWDKMRIGMGYHYRARYEFILFFEKGKRRLADLGIPDVLQSVRVHGGYPTEKPVDLIKTLVSQSGLPGEVVADPFMGSGSTGVAALELGCQFWGNDLSASAKEHATQRLAATRVPGRPPAPPTVIECQLELLS